VSLMSDWEYKLDAIVKETIQENVTSLAGVPSWMLVLLNRVLEYSSKNNLTQIWPNLEVYFHGGVSFIPYRYQYQNVIKKGDFRYYEIYNASEGFFAVQDRNNSDELLLMLDYGIFYEFIPMDTYGKEYQYAIPLSQVDLNTIYAVVITTNAGLWRYKIGDTVRFTSVNPYRIKISGRTKHYINVFGEELVIENAETAIAITCKLLNAEITDFTVAPIFMEGKEKGAHEWLIEFKKAPSCINEFREVLDKELQQLNSDYKAKRYLNMTLNPPKIQIAKSELFHTWLKTKDKLGGQHKIPRLSNSRVHLEELLAMNTALIA